jgi:hypothetical protein
MNIAQAMAALQAAVTAPLAALKLGCRFYDTPEDVLAALEATRPGGGTVAINLGEDTAPDEGFGAFSVYTIHVTVAVAHGLAMPGTGAGVHTDATARDSFLSLFASVVETFRLVVWKTSEGDNHPQVKDDFCRPGLTYMGSQPMADDPEQQKPLRTRTARFRFIFAFPAIPEETPDLVATAD